MEQQRCYEYRINKLHLRAGIASARKKNSTKYRHEEVEDTLEKMASINIHIGNILTVCFYHKSCSGHIFFFLYLWLWVFECGCGTEHMQKNVLLSLWYTIYTFLYLFSHVDMNDAVLLLAHICFVCLHFADSKLEFEDKSIWDRRKREGE